MKFKSLLAIGISLTTLGLSSAAWAAPISDTGIIPSSPYPNACDGPVLPKKCGGGYGGGRKHVPQAPSASRIKMEPQKPELTTIPSTGPTIPTIPINPQPHR
jgi:hypothetical protein